MRCFPAVRHLGAIWYLTAVFCEAALCLSALTVCPVCAQWIEGGVSICALPGDQYPTTLVSDGAGGAFIVWPDERTGTADIYAQRIDKHGVPLWAPGGIIVCALVNGQLAPFAVSDGAGGIIVAWSDLRSGVYDVYAQRIDGDGNLLWVPSGVAISAISAEQRFQRIASDGSGGAIICWVDNYSGNENIFAQRIDASGALQWSPSGVPICTSAEDQTSPWLVSDDAGGAIVTWRDYRNGSDYNIYAQRINHAGSTLWTYNGVAVCTAINYQGIGIAVSDGSKGAIIVWEDLRGGIYYDIYAQRIDSLGTIRWLADGRTICTEAFSQTNPYIIMAESGDAIIVWQDERSGGGADIYAQMIDLSGSFLWATGGVPVSTAAGWQFDPQVVSDLEGGVAVVWADSRNGDNDIYAQRLDASGAALWTADGVAACWAENDQYQPFIVTDGEAGFITIYRYENGTDMDLYAQRVEKFGYWGFPAPTITGVRDVLEDQGGRVTVTWDASSHDCYPYEEITRYSVWRMLPDDILAALMLQGVDPMVIEEGGPLLTENDERWIVFAGESYGWEWLGDVGAYYFPSYTFTAETYFDSTTAGTSYHHFIVISHTDDHFVFWKSEPDSGYSVDNLAPCMPEGVTAEQSIDPEGFEIAWEPNTEPDLACYAIYRSTNPLFEPSPETLLSNPCDPDYFDDEWLPTSGFWYKLAAVDIHGNESEYVLISPGGVTGEQEPVTPVASYLHQNFPNPFNATTRIRFGLRAPAPVSLRIYDAAGHLVRTLVEEPYPAGRFGKDWDGRDNAGRSVASGIYFYRLEVGTFEETKKMVLLR